MAKKKAAKKGKKAAKKKGGAKRKPNAAFMKPMQPDAALSAVVGSKPIPRTEITKKLWQYIKRNGLQDAKERRMINADDKLRAVFGGKGKVSMFEMTKLVSKHMK
jgi:upstream activation factor subunit UAF30